MLYKDVQRVTQEGKRRKHWDRMTLPQVKVWIEKAKQAKSRHIFTTIQTFSSAEEADDEPVIAPFYADFDGEGALNDARKMVEWWINQGVAGKFIQIHFSGKKGFHIVIPEKMFGIKPAVNVPQVWRQVARKIKKELNLNTLDETVYSHRRMWRVPGTIHGDTGLYKTPLLPEELFNLTLEQIKEAAKVEQEPSYVLPDRSLENLSNIYHVAEKQLERYNISETWEAVEVNFDEPPECVKALLEAGVFELGTVNMVMYRLAAYFKSQNLSIEETRPLLYSWIENIKPEVTHTLTKDGLVDIGSLRKQVRYVTGTVFSGKQYGFSCGGMLQIPGLENICTPECQEKLEQKVEVTLFNAFDIENQGKRLYINAEAIGRNDDTIAVPDEIEVWCDQSGINRCEGCPLNECKDGITVKLTAKTKNILTWLEPSVASTKNRIISMLHLPTQRICTSWRYKITQKNCETIMLAPLVTNSFEREDRYIRQQAYYLGFGLLPNTSYTFSGYLHINDKTMKKRLVLDKAEPLKDTLSSFVFTDEMKEQSKIFRPVDGQTYAIKHNHIVDTFAYNHIRVWGRSLLIKMVDLAFHSVNKFWFQRELVNGWIDLLIIGDTGQGKSKIVESLMELYNLGIKVSGESAKRTGLTYTIPMTGKEQPYIVWGVIPRYNGRLVAVDELDSLIKSGNFSELTDVRSSGKVVVTQTVFGQANAQTRMIWITNAVGRKTMKSYGFPVMAINDLIRQRQDVRRFTAAVGVASGQVDDSIINADIDELKVYNDIYSGEVCHNHLLWVWNLKPDDIIIEKSVEQTILALSNSMCQEYIPAVPLIEPGDFRFKLAKFSIAAAARMDSRDGDKLIVTDEAVKYTYDFLNEVYSDEAMNYFGYSVAYAKYAYTPEQMAEIVTQFKNRYPYDWERIGSALMLSVYIKAKEISATLNTMDDKDVRESLSWLAGKKLLESTATSAYRKTPIGVSFIETLLPADNLPSLKTATEVLGDEKDEF